jgi:hypothetical protein
MDVAVVVGIVVTWTSAAAGPPAQTQAMVREADAIWRPYGVSVVALPAADADPPLPREGPRLTVTFVDAGRRSPPLGAIAFDHENVPSSTLKIDVGAVRAAIAATRWADRPIEQWPRAFQQAVVGRALGRVLAHEIGHFLLASRAHAAAGLMRAAFDGRQLAQPGREDFQVSARELPRLRARVAGLARPEALAEVVR